jgi:thiamine-monophosphate kinase
MTTTALGAGREFDRIRAIARALGDRASDLGNDCALVDVAGVTLALTTDVSVEKIHFRREWLTLEEIGWRATAASLSDLAAAAAEPIGVLAALTMSAGEPEESFAAVMRGCGAAAASVGGVVLGGDLSRGESLALAITSVGRTSHAMRRRGARPGDTVWVTGALGGARAALAAWTAGREPDPGARIRFARPEPRIAAGRWLAGQGARAMMDLSDGLAGDAGHLAAASGVTLRIALDRLPIHPAVAPEAGRVGDSPPVFAARGGEDYELLVVMPAGFPGTGAPGVPLTAIGVVESGAPRAILEFGGTPVSLTSYDHFA